jgi:hypothetical protein
MPLTLNLGLSKKIGLPDYGSLGASCHVALELDGRLLESDLDAFHAHVRSAYVACRQAVEDELTRGRATITHESARSPVPTGRARTNGTDRIANGRHASHKQLDYARQLAQQVEQVGRAGLPKLVERLYQKPLTSLSGLEASGLIDTLKAIQAGRLAWEEVLAEAVS